jgi:hypothetical protein
LILRILPYISCVGVLSFFVLGGLVEATVTRSKSRPNRVPDPTGTKRSFRKNVAIPSGDDRSSWHARDRELRFGGKFLFRLGRAPVIKLILDAFMEEDFSTRIDDPLSPRDGIEAKERLRDAIKRLNLKLAKAKAPIRFHGDGTGQGIWWSLLVGATVRKSHS